MFLPSVISRQLVLILMLQGNKNGKIDFAKSRNIKKSNHLPDPILRGKRIS